MPSQRRYLRDSEPGDVIQDVFIVSGKQLSATTTGKPFIKLFVSDRSASLTARMWNASRDAFAAMPESGFVRLNARIENYQNNLQVIVENFWPPEPGSFKLEDLLPHTSRDIAQLRQHLEQVCTNLRNRHLRALLRAYFDDQALMADFCKAPAASAFHHAFIGGLLEHTVNAIDVALAVCPFYPSLNADLVVAGLFLHDLGKTWELTYDGAFSYSDGGNLIGHIVKSVIWIEQKAALVEQAGGEKIPQPLIDVLQHIVLSHHGTTDFGSPKTPATPEAIAVHMIENLDAKMMVSLSAARGTAAPGCEGNWSEYLKSMGGRLYRPDVAPPDDQLPSPPPPAGAAPKPAQAAAPATNNAAPPVPAAERPAPRPGEVVISNPLFESVPARKK